MDGEVSLSPCKWNLVPREQFSIEAAISSSVIRRKSARSSCLRPNEHNVRLEPHGAVNWERFGDDYEVEYAMG